MKASFLSKLVGLVPEGIRDEQGVCRAEDVGRPGIDASATTPCACALRWNAPASTSAARARRLPQQVSARARVHIAKALGASLTDPRVLPADAARAARYGGRNALAAEGQVHAAGDDDSDQPAQVRAAEQPGRDGSLQGGDEAVFNGPAGDQARHERRDPCPVDVAIGAPLRLPVELVDVDVTAPL